jgi:hypothetical protein
VTPPRHETTESPKATPPNPQSYGLGAIGGHQPGGSSFAPPSGKQRIYSQVAKSLWDDPDFIQVGFHIVHYNTAVVDTDVECTNAKQLYSDLEFTSDRIHVNNHCPIIFSSSI